MIFSAVVSNYRTTQASAYTLIRSLLGDFDFDELYDADRIIGPMCVRFGPRALVRGRGREGVAIGGCRGRGRGGGDGTTERETATAGGLTDAARLSSFGRFFMIYIALAILVILNMIIAIIADAYVDASDEMKAKPQVSIVKDVVEVVIHYGEHIKHIPIVGPIILRKAKHAKNVALTGADQRAAAGSRAAVTREWFRHPTLTRRAILCRNEQALDGGRLRQQVGRRLRHLGRHERHRKRRRESGAENVGHDVGRRQRRQGGAARSGTKRRHQGGQRARRSAGAAQSGERRARRSSGRTAGGPHAARDSPSGVHLSHRPHPSARVPPSAARLQARAPRSFLGSLGSVRASARPCGCGVIAECVGVVWCGGRRGW